MTFEQYYTAPKEAVFNEIKDAAIKIWSGYSDEFGYASEKINAIKNLKNVSDNAWYMVAMFDYSNRQKLLSMVSFETAEMINDAMDS